MDTEAPIAPDALKRVSDVMIPLDGYPSIGPDDSLRRAVEVIEKCQLECGGRRSLPRVLLVVENGGELVGILRRRDIMRGLEPRFLVSQRMEYQKKFFDVAVDPNLSELPFDRVVKGVRSQADRPVREVMRSVGATIEPGDHLMKAIYEMVSLNLSLLPVMDRGRVLGVIRSVDVFHELAQLLV